MRGAARLGATLAFLGAIAVLGVSSLSDGGTTTTGAVARPAPAGVAPLTPDGRVRIQVLNGGGVTGMARAATQVLRDHGFDVVEIGNASDRDAERASSVIVRSGSADLGSSVARALGIDNVVSDPDPNLYVDVSVWLGSEWVDPAFRSEVDERGERAWWDPRRWRAASGADEHP